MSSDFMEELQAEKDELELFLTKYKKELMENQLKQTKQQLADLEKELEYYFGLTQAQITEIYELKQQIKDQRHQVCDEIREFIAKDLCGCSIEEWTHKIGWNEDLIKVFNKLDQIEKKGEEQ